MSDLAAALGVQPPTVTKMISRLAAQDYVERRASKGDGRQALVFLTARGRRTIVGIDKVWKRIEKDAISGIDDKDRKKLRKLLRQIERNLGAFRSGDDEDELASDDEEPAAIAAE
jgi:DNA-binding MarR family transcriptional regulator